MVAKKLPDLGTSELGKTEKWLELLEVFTIINRMMFGFIVELESGSWAPGTQVWRYVAQTGLANTAYPKRIPSKNLSSNAYGWGREELFRA